MREPIAIIGGGIGGLACAVALGRRGRTCDVFEQAPRLEEVGAGLLLTPNAVSVLQSLGLLAALLPSAVSTPFWRILDPAGVPLQELRPFPAGMPAISLRRSDLQAALADALPSGSLHLGWQATALEPLPTGMRVRFRHRADVTAPLVVAADGSASALRRVVSPTRRMRELGYVGWRALVDGVPDHWSDGRITETWGSGRRFGIAPVGGGRTYWYASANTELIGSDPSSQQRERLTGLFHGWHEPVQALIARTPEAAILQHPIADGGLLSSWTAWGRLALLGDAAHPLTPNLGQGAAMALEDAWILARCLAADQPLAVALRAYRRRRRARVALVWTASRLLGNVIQWSSPWKLALRSVALRATPDHLASAALSRLYRFSAS